MTTFSADAGDLTLGHIFGAVGIATPEDVLVIRHTYTEDGLRRGDITPDKVLTYTRVQKLRFSKQQPATWLIFMADGGRRARFFTTFDNLSEVIEERTETWRSFDLRPSGLMRSLTNRLVIEWGKDTINWAKSGTTASTFPVVEIADPEAVPFPGFDRIVVGYPDLQTLVEDWRYASWRTALGSVQGVYLIADASTGKQYVGKADGSERILGRWKSYARDGHGGNVALRALAEQNRDHARHFVFSLLRVFGPDTPTSEVDEAEAHFKRALLTREFGLNRT